MDRDNLKYTNVVLERIAAALEETLRLVKQDQEEAKKRWEKESEQTTRASNGPSIPAALEMAPGSRTKLQAASLTAAVGYDRIKTERKNKYEYKK